MKAFTRISFICYLSIATALAFFASCRTQKDFDPTGWSFREDNIWYPNRPAMLEDLLLNQKLVGIKFADLEDLLGFPNDTTSLSGGVIASYSVDLDFGSDIDPIYSKRLKFDIDADSIVRSYKIVEFRK